MSKSRKELYEKEAAICFEAAAIAMQKEIPDYGEAERQSERAKTAIGYARKINNGTYTGEEF